MRFVIPVLLLFLFSCKDNNIPTDVLPSEKMEKVLWELLEADELAYHQHPTDSIARKQAALQYFAQVYQLNQIDAATYNRSYDYYCDRPELLSPVLDSARNRATPPASVPSDTKSRKISRAL